MATEFEVRVPDIGDFKDVPVIEVLVKPGDAIDVDTPVIVLETDKATMEVPSPAAGVVGVLSVKVGDRINKGDTILMVAAADRPAHAPDESAAAPSAAAAAAPSEVVELEPESQADVGVNAMRVVTVPDLGDFKDVPLVEILVHPGDTVAKDAPLFVLESDKSTMEIPSPMAGVIQDIAVRVGDRLKKGDRLLTLLGEVAVPSAPPAASQTGASIEMRKEPAGPALTAALQLVSEGVVLPIEAKPSAVAGPLPAASPMIRKLARELGVDLIRVVGSGSRGRVLKEDVEAFVRQELSRPAGAAAAPAANGALAGLLPWPKVDFAKFGSVERQSLVRLRKISGANLSRNWVMIPHVTNFDEADITELEAFRQQVNREQKAEAPRLTLLCFLIKACVEVLRRFPEYNASLDGEELVLKRYFHIGFAADTPNGLVVPVIRDADKKGLSEIAKEASDLAALARGGKLKPEHMQGGCFSISSLGGIGGTGFTPIINAPEVAILGVTKAELKPKWDGKQFGPRLMVPLNLSWDHRVVDGASAARFLVALCALLSDFRRVCL